MTDNEIKKALECCLKYETHLEASKWCEECPYKDDTKCLETLPFNALDLINRLQAENERLQDCIDEQDIEISRLYKRIDETKAEAEVERLKKSNRNWRRKVQRLRNAKAEAYKECIEKVNKELFYWVGTDNCIPYLRVKQVIDNTLDELVGDNK